MIKSLSKLLICAGLILLLLACAPNYSSGERVGVVTKLSEKGVMYKSWEGEALLALPAGTSMVQPETFKFNVAPSAVDKVKKAMESGKRVQLVYKQWLFSPPSIENDHVVIDVKETTE